MSMDCLQAREAISARMDGELPAVAHSLVEAHVHRCPGCQAWTQAAHDVTRRARMTGWTTPSELPDFAERLVGSKAKVAWIPRVRSVLLVLAAIGQFTLAIVMMTGAGEQIGMHGDHELGVFDITLAVAFAVGAFRSRLAPGLAWPAGAAAAGLLITATVDVMGHHTFELHELKHLIAVAGALLLCWAARDAKRSGPDGARGFSGELTLRRADQTTQGWAA
jgi:predicted anti-sigma-YlaC factor YlaD